MNPILRELFDLGPTIEVFSAKMEKLQRVIPHFVGCVHFGGIMKSFLVFVVGCYTKCSQQNKGFAAVKAKGQTHGVLLVVKKLCLKLFYFNLFSYC